MALRRLINEIRYIYYKYFIYNKYKSLYLTYKKLYESSIYKISKLNGEIFRLNKLTKINDSVNRLCEDNFRYEIIPFKHNDKLYIISKEYVYYAYSYAYSFEINLKIYDAHNNINRTNAICTLECDIDLKTKTSTLQNIDTVPEYQKEGFASILISYLEKQLQIFEILSLCGRLLERSPIGLNNLINFYKKNGFKIRQKKDGSQCFYKKLK